MVVANTMHASSPASGAIIRSPAETVRARAPAQARVAATLTAISRSFSVGPGTIRSTAQKARIKKQAAAKSQMSTIILKSPSRKFRYARVPAAGYHRIRMESRAISNLPLFRNPSHPR